MSAPGRWGARRERIVSDQTVWKYFIDLRKPWCPASDVARPVVRVGHFPHRLPGDICTATMLVKWLVSL